MAPGCATHNRGDGAPDSNLQRLACLPLKFKAVPIFSGLWLLVVYAPIRHWVWGGGRLGDRGVMDFAGALVVHTSAGVSALVVAGLSLDVFAVHGVGGMLGTLLVAFLATGALGGSGLPVGSGDVGPQPGVQALGVVVTAARAGGCSYLIAKATAGMTGGLRVTAEEEQAGLDLPVHGERGYDL